MGVSPPKNQLPPTPKSPAHTPKTPPPPQFILSLSKDELGVPQKPNPKIPPPNPLTTYEHIFYTNPNAKTSFPQTAPNGGSHGVKSRPG